MSRKYMPIGVFVDEGYLQEVNRLLLHPLGTALEVKQTKEPVTWLGLGDAPLENLRNLIAAAAEAGHDPLACQEIVRFIDEAERRDAGDAFLSGVWDERDDLEGIYFLPGPSEAKAAHIAGLSEARSSPRIKRLGSKIQEVKPDA